jgi:predicted porin
MNNFSFGGQYEDSENPGGAKSDYTAWALTGKATFGNNAISLVYTDAELEGKGAFKGADAERDGWGVAAEHNFSKRTKVYAAYAAGNNTVKSSSPLPATKVDLDDDVFSLGMIHNF